LISAMATALTVRSCVRLKKLSSTPTKLPDRNW